MAGNVVKLNSDLWINSRVTCLTNEAVNFLVGLTLLIGLFGIKVNLVERMLIHAPSSFPRVQFLNDASGVADQGRIPE